MYRYVNKGSSKAVGMYQAGSKWYCTTFEQALACEQTMNKLLPLQFIDDISYNTVYEQTYSNAAKMFLSRVL